MMFERIAVVRVPLYGQTDPRPYAWEVPGFTLTGSLVLVLVHYWTGRTYMPLPGKGLERHICPTIVTLWWRHCDII